jgi:hypothetical protein
MFRNKVKVTSTAIDSGDTIPIRPSHRSMDGDDYRNASRLSPEQVVSTRSMRDIDLMQPTLPTSSFIRDAHSRTDCEDYEVAQISDSTIIAQCFAIDHHHSAVQKDSKNRERQRIVFTGLLIILIVLLVTALTLRLWIIHLRHDDEPLTSQK